ncbi:hypothetical protein MGA3_13911 [Bacillus methanolicus MGA3]|uniref:Uncharacterized protein n=1 Tax=Bacillus methanolicus (strain MGA3 / ATCC 53907) TaxID=796606 RepID=I3DYY5_BACMM|nr:hypothetical protein BMMGA3_05515 [Bacillus methanolicus MGA3]EIJ79456.1 hypothetical protein MGA3_13911 [Bacillus methanolicus MGA3]UQD51590.1 hypothetical protein C0971_05790 [Bacillus methanolicus]
MRFVKITLQLLILSSLLLGCRKDIPKPETNISILPIDYVDAAANTPVSVLEDERDRTFFVRHHVRNGNLYIECMISGISFRSNHTGNKGKMILFIDGKKTKEISSAAFIVKGLNPGTHKVKLEIVKINNQPYDLTKEFYATIP